MFSVQHGAGATLYYALATLAMTWPLAAGLARDIPGDLGDPVLNCWILRWGADHWLRLLGGDLSAFQGYFNANIFYPEPLTLAYSEHLTAQVLQILPVYAITHNIVLCYNLLFLSTFVLSGLGTYLLVRELTGSWRAAFVAGLLYAFAPYRIGQFSHVQVLSSQWMPFALYGLRRYFQSGRNWTLAAASSAVVAQFWSTGYFLVYFAPFLAAYVIYEMTVCGLLRTWRVWRALLAAAAAIAVATVPLVLPYLDLRTRGFGPRPFEEVLKYSADVYSYLTAHGAQRLWGAVVRAFPKPEGDLFPSVMPVLLACLGVAAHMRTVLGAEAKGEGGQASFWRRALVAIAFAVCLSQLAAAVVILATTGIDWQVGPWILRVHNLARAFRTAAIASAVLLILSPPARRLVRGVPRSAVAFYAAALVMAFWLSLGPILYARGMRIDGDGPYWWLYAHMPGWDGLRVPARMGMLTMLFLSVLGGYGAAALDRIRGWGGALVLAAGVVFLVEATSAPIELNATSDVPDCVPPPKVLAHGSHVPQVYRAVKELPKQAVIVEFPFGDDQYDLRYMVASAEHWRPLLNGYSGGFPVSSAVNRAALGRVLTDPAPAWAVLTKSGATFAIVHEGIFLNDQGTRVTGWLVSHGARVKGTFGTDVLLELAPPK